MGDSTGRIEARRRRPIDATGDPIRDVERLVDDARALVSDSGLEIAEIECVGLSVPGPLDAKRGRVLDPPNLPGWGEVPLARWVREALGRPVRIENDANAAALAEWRFGAARGFGHVVYLTMSTGVGGGLVLDGQLYRGAAGRAGEIGHLPVEWPGAPCACGRRGCLEAYVGGRAWTERLRAETPETSAVARLAGARARVGPEHVVAAAGEGDDFACSELARFNRYLARGIVALGFVLAPQIVVLGTIAAAAGEALCLEPVRGEVRAALWESLATDLVIAPAALGEEGAYLAGLCAALEGAVPAF